MGSDCVDCSGPGVKKCRECAARLLEEAGYDRNGAVITSGIFRREGQKSTTCNVRNRLLTDQQRFERGFIRPSPSPVEGEEIFMT